MDGTRGSGDGGEWVDEPTASMVSRVADSLRLRVVGPLAGGLFGAVLVTDSNLERLVLKVLPQVALASVWATGAAMATRLREAGYPAPRYVGTGTLGDTVWSLQEYLAGEVPRRLGSDHARQLVGLARRHDADSGLRRDWHADARAAARGWLATLPPSVPRALEQKLRPVLDRAGYLEMIETSIVHGDFHPRNCLVDGDSVCGVFDWEIAGAGDWRFDLVNLTFWCLVGPSSCEHDAAQIVIEATKADTPRPVATFMMACQVLRALSTAAAYRPSRLATTCQRIQANLTEWFERAETW